jgi:hypothetical protein
VAQVNELPPSDLAVETRDGAVEVDNGVDRVTIVLVWA